MFDRDIIFSVPSVNILAPQHLLVQHQNTSPLFNIFFTVYNENPFLINNGFPRSL